MGTVVSIQAYGERVSQVNYAITRAQEEFQRLDNLLSLYKPDSLLSRVNRLAGKEEVRVPIEFIALIDSARLFHQQTQGAFDVTVEPLMRLWGFRSEEHSLHRLPSDREIASRLEAVGFHRIAMNRNAQTVGLTHERACLDFGGIAVGYSVDRAVNILRAEGIESAFINHSGDAYALGAPLDAEGWEVAIPNPLNTRETAERLMLRDKAISTSGGYEKFVTAGGDRHGHVLNPATGKSADSLLSATVVADSSLDADALSTGFFCLGVAGSRRSLKNLPLVRLVAIARSESSLSIYRF